MCVFVHVKKMSWISVSTTGASCLTRPGPRAREAKYMQWKLVAKIPRFSW